MFPNVIYKAVKIQPNHLQFHELPPLHLDITRKRQQ